MENIAQELLKLEFRNRKDIAEAERRFNERFERSSQGFDRMQVQIEEMRAIQRQTQLHLNYITKLTGVSFDKFEDIESRIEKAATALKPKAKLK